MDRSQKIYLKVLSKKRVVLASALVVFSIAWLIKACQLIISAQSVHPVTLTVQYSDASLSLSMVKIYGISVVGNYLKAIEKESSDGISVYKIDYVYLKRIGIKLPEEIFERLEHIEVKTGKKIFFFTKDEFKKQWIKIDSKMTTFESPDSMRGEKSILPLFRSAINWKGDLTFIVQSIKSIFRDKLLLIFILVMTFFFSRVKEVVLKEKMEYSLRKKDFSDNKIVLVSGGVYLILCLSIFRFTIDDAYIPYLYAKNIVEHSQIVPSLNNFVQGYTNFLFVLISAFVYLFSGKIHIESIMKILLIFSGVITIYFVDLVQKKLHVIKESQIIALLLLATSTPFLVWTAGGLETIFLAMQLVIVTYYYLSITSDCNKAIDKIFSLRLFLLLVFVFTSFLTRWDSLLFNFSILMGLLRTCKSKIHILIFNILCFLVLPIIAYLLWVNNYYGEILPKSFYKVNESLSFGKIRLGLEYFMAFVKVHFMLFMGTIITIVYLIRKRLAILLQSREIFILFSVIIYIIFIIIQGNVHMMYTFRFYTPLLPILCILCSKGFAAFFTAINNKKYKQYTMYITIGLVLISNLIIFHYAYYKDMVFVSKQSNYYLNTKEKGSNLNIRGQILLHGIWKKAAIFFDELVPSGSNVYCWSAGIFPFYIDANFYDELLIGRLENQNYDYIIKYTSSLDIRSNNKSIVQYPFKKPSAKATYYPWHTSFYLKNTKGETLRKREY